MNKLFVSILFLFTFVTLNSQTSISGVINQYSKVNLIENNSCQNKITVTDIAPFDEGQMVLLMQMQGATMDESNSANFGNIQNLNNAGIYEVNEIIAIDGFDIYLKYQNINEYDINGQVQLITIPTFSNAVVNNTLTANPWNGETGGVLALNVSGNLMLNANIDVSGLGFRGGIAQTATNNNCSWLFQQNDYFYEEGNWRGSAKGEGIVPVIMDKEFGKGAQANGGGGGNDHNSGGGGGANITNGGSGGENDEPQTFGCQGNHPGIGGKGINNFSNRLFLGGGGGAGHENNEVGTDGANGGGIVILFVNNLIPEGYSILANGDSTIDGGGDGAGGGGAGGSIILEVQNLSSNIHLEANGGNGGLINNNGENRCHGPGGGGSGGRILTNLGIGDPVTTSISGGQAGMSINSTACSDGTNGATAGEDGLVESFSNNIFASVEFLLPEANFSFSNNMLTVDFTNLSQNINTVNWDFGDGNMSTSLNPIHTFSQTGTYNVQLIITNDCGIDSFSQSIYVEVVEANFTLDEAGGCVTHTVNFQNNSLGTIDSLLWTFEGGEPMISTDDNPQVVYNSSGIFDVQLEVYGSQGVDTLLFQDTIEVLDPPVANFDYFSPVQGTFNFNNNSTNANSFEWDFGDGSSIATQEMPFHIYNSTGTYVVTLTAFNEYCSNTFTDTISFLTNVEDLWLNEIKVFPNPTDDFLTIQIQDEVPVIMEMYSVHGEKIDWITREIIQTEKINIRELPAGVYFVSIIRDNQKRIYQILKF